MKREIAYSIIEGKIEIPFNTNLGELLQLATGACLEDDGNIWCLVCHKPNESCVCKPPLP